MKGNFMCLIRMTGCVYVQSMIGVFEMSPINHSFLGGMVNFNWFMMLFLQASPQFAKLKCSVRFLWFSPTASYCCRAPSTSLSTIMQSSLEKPLEKPGAAWRIVHSSRNWEHFSANAWGSRMSKWIGCGPRLQVTDAEGCMFLLLQKAATFLDIPGYARIFDISWHCHYTT